MPVPVQDLKRLLGSTRPDAALVLVEGDYVVAGGEDLDGDALRGALTVVTKDDLVERVGAGPVSDRALEEAAAALSSAVDNLGG
ncbi:MULTISPECIES: hypothetical protein [Lentzea]|uniref:Uncharacterized protein n=1 Tax=Lentzea jiangxiensis TaxID=641025 RepID=A0A1H0LAN8_9PSEU|nr:MULTISPECIES: hypothetical protein [Lentzea]MCG8922572.1 hypothetical protein [Lentzea sp. CC55]WVH83142.1 hypothetical protein V1227_10455 [Lentzea sp. DG1S-22]SDO65063.1 hypothetical protein SAMN05421507_103242 [Lentzea jiangxiensis]